MRTTRFVPLIISVVILSVFGARSSPAGAEEACSPDALAALAESEPGIDGCPDLKIRENIHKLINEAKDSCARNDSIFATLLVNRATNFQQGCLYKMTCRGPVRIGMNNEQIKHTVWCKPDHVNRTITAGHVEEQWIYSGKTEMEGAVPPRGYLYFTDGVLTAIQER